MKKSGKIKNYDRNQLNRENKILRQKNKILNDKIKTLTQNEDGLVSTPMKKSEL